MTEGNRNGRPMSAADIARRLELVRVLDEWSRGARRVQTSEDLQTLLGAIVDYGRHLEAPATSLASAAGSLELASARLARITGKP